LNTLGAVVTGADVGSDVVGCSDGTTGGDVSDVGETSGVAGETGAVVPAESPEPRVKFA